MDYSRWCATVLAIMLGAAPISSATNCTIVEVGEKPEAILTCPLPHTSNTFEIRRIKGLQSRSEDFLGCKWKENERQCEPTPFAKCGRDSCTSRITWTNKTMVFRMTNLTADDQKYYMYFCALPAHAYGTCFFQGKFGQVPSLLNNASQIANSSNDPTSTSVPAQVTPTTSQNVPTKTSVPRNSVWSSPGAIVGYVFVAFILGLLLCFFLERKCKLISRLSRKNSAPSELIAMEDIPTTNARSRQENTAEGRARSTSLTHGDDLQIDGGNMAAATPEGCEEELEIVHQLKERLKHRQHICSQVDGGNVTAATPEGYEQELELANQLEEKIKQLSQMFCQLRAEAQLQATPSTTASSAGSSVNRLTLSSTNELTASAGPSMTAPITCTEAEQPRPDSAGNMATDDSLGMLYPATEDQGFSERESRRLNALTRNSRKRTHVREPVPLGNYWHEKELLLHREQPKYQQGSAKPARIKVNENSD